MTSKFTMEPKRIDWQKTGIFLAVLGLAAVIIFSLSQCHKPPKPDPALGKAVRSEITSKGVEVGAKLEAAVPALQARVETHSNDHVQRTKRHVANVRAVAAASPPAAVNFPDDEFYRSVCEPGGLYQGHPERSGACSEPASGAGSASKRAVRPG